MNNTRIEGRMVIARKTITKEIPLKEDYSYVKYSEQYKTKMNELFQSLHQDISIDSFLESNRKAFKENCLLVECNGELVGCAGLNIDDENRLYIAYIGIKEEHQGNGIGRSMISRLCVRYDDKPNKYPLYASVNSEGYREIMLLARMGFMPFLGETSLKSEEQSEADWEVLTALLKEKSLKN